MESFVLRRKVEIQMEKKGINELFHRMMEQYRKNFGSISDHEGHYDIDGVSFSEDTGVIVASDENKKQKSDPREELKMPKT